MPHLKKKKMMLHWPLNQCIAMVIPIPWTKSHRKPAVEESLQAMTLETEGVLYEGTVSDPLLCVFQPQYVVLEKTQSCYLYKGEIAQSVKLID